jgi:hypothetical protein
MRNRGVRIEELRPSQAAEYGRISLFDAYTSLAELRKCFDEKQIVELTLVICAANFTNRFNDAVRVAPDLGG